MWPNWWEGSLRRAARPECCLKLITDTLLITSTHSIIWKAYEGTMTFATLKRYLFSQKKALYLRWRVSRTVAHLTPFFSRCFFSRKHKILKVSEIILYYLSSPCLLSIRLSIDIVSLSSICQSFDWYSSDIKKWKCDAHCFWELYKNWQADMYTQ